MFWIIPLNYSGQFDVHGDDERDSISLCFPVFSLHTDSDTLG